MDFSSKFAPAAVDFRPQLLNRSESLPSRCILQLPGAGGKPRLLKLEIIEFAEHILESLEIFDPGLCLPAPIETAKELEKIAKFFRCDTKLMERESFRVFAEIAPAPFDAFERLEDSNFGEYRNRSLAVGWPIGVYWPIGKEDLPIFEQAGESL